MDAVRNEQPFGVNISSCLFDRCNPGILYLNWNYSIIFTDKISRRNFSPSGRFGLRCKGLEEITISIAFLLIFRLRIMNGPLQAT